MEDKVNSERSEKLEMIRPKLDLETSPERGKERFQNEVLRPILKFQNELLLSFFKGSKQFAQHLSKVDRTNKVNLEVGLKDFIKSNHAFRNRCYGMIAGMMKLDEHQEYLINESEYNRRIISMLVVRVAGQL